MIDKSQHLVTVPRAYLEMLEGIYEDVKEKEYNLSGQVRKVMTTLSPFPDNILFIQENAITKQESQKLIVVDSIGKERLIYRLEQKIVD